MEKILKQANLILDDRGQPNMLSNLDDTIISFDNWNKNFYDGWEEEEIRRDSISAIIYTNNSEYNQEQTQEIITTIKKQTNYEEIPKFALYQSGTGNTTIIQGFGIKEDNYYNLIKFNFILIIQKPAEHTWSRASNWDFCTKIMGEEQEIK